jgi:hypothetical protein
MNLKQKKIENIFTSKFVGTGSLSYEKNRNLPGRGLTKVEKHCSTCTCFELYLSHPQEVKFYDYSFWYRHSENK